MGTERAGMSPREISTWASLASTLVIYAIFFASTASGAVRGSDQVGLFIALLCAQVAALVVFHIVLAALRGPERTDERDRFIELRSFRHAYVVLVTGVAFVTVGYLAWGGIAAEQEAAAAGVAPPSVALVGNAILLCFVLAEIAKSGTEVILYRRS